ncbi:unnamed protein product [Didymodactylos carnosus]|uniref:Uncharacterized protein n=1 Tax=Didymodactylos carnosus TaxID=1234261 RepID=A0A8S2EA94_9BILA|nr:unnamed protein product [Didymodactylos carnosus]CAF3983630.1 unnamed protein product [Didymodactylos carnosus]
MRIPICLFCNELKYSDDYSDLRAIETTTTCPFGTWNLNATTVAGGNGVGNAKDQLRWPNDLAIDNNQDIYVADTDNQRIQKWSAGSSSGITVFPTNGFPFSLPTALFLDQNKYLYISDDSNFRILKWAIDGSEAVRIVAGGNGSGDGLNQINSCHGIFVDNNSNVYVSDYYNHRVVKWIPGSSSGIVVAGGNEHGSELNQLFNPMGIFVTSDDVVYVADTLNHRIMKWVPDYLSGVIVAGENGSGSNLNQLKNPSSVSVDLYGNVYASDITNSRIMKWTPGAIDGTIMSSDLSGPFGLKFDKYNNLYVADRDNNRIQKFSFSSTSCNAGEQFMTTTTKQSVLKTMCIITLGFVSWRLIF